MIRSIKNLFSSKANNENSPEPVSAANAGPVNSYYDRENDMYLNTYGTILQASRPSSDEEFIHYLSNSIGFKDGMHVIDAGCGVCGPSILFAQKHNIHIDAVTISKVQKDVAEVNIVKHGLGNRIKVTQGDFAYLDNIYNHQVYDLVFFLESLGHANNPQKVIESSFKVLKPGGFIYIKDFFSVPLVSQEHLQIQNAFLDMIREQYSYRPLDLIELIRSLRDQGLYVDFIRPLNLVEDFSKAALFEQVNTSHDVYTKALQNPFQVFEPLEVRFRKIH